MKKIKLLYVFTSCRRCGPIQVMYNLFKYIDKNRFELHLITLYDETKDSRLSEFLLFCISHVKCKMTKLDILLSRNTHLYDSINKIRPDIIHAMGVFAEYAIKDYMQSTKILTLHSFIKYDYKSSFGFIRGNMLIQLQKKSMRKYDQILVCSKSLRQLYMKEGNKYDYIVNGVDTEIFYKVSKKRKKLLRNKLNISTDVVAYISTGRFVRLKAQETIIKGFLNSKIRDSVLILLGNGPLFEKLNKRYFSNKNVIFVGDVDNVRDYLQACDVYISAAHFEGMPMGVLEACSCGLPLILSDILPHREIIEDRQTIGELFQVDNYEDCSLKIKKVLIC